MRVFYLYAVSFVSAFLLFQIELIVSKILLPKFGGSYLVWGACVVFFQCVLLLGYVYAHAMVRAAGMHRYKVFHLVLILSPFLFFPGRPLSIQPDAGLAMVAGVFLQLVTSIGLVFFVLSTISLISQSWLSASELPQRRNPYTLYAVSNIGSFLALLTYPFLFEYYFDLDQQILFWRIGYVIFILIYAAAFFAVKVSEDAGPDDEDGTSERADTDERPADGDWKNRIRWFLLAAAGTVIFLAVTNVITYEMAPCPLLWVVPLGIYLLSFVLVFQDKPVYPLWIINRQYIVLGLSAVLFFLSRMRSIHTGILFLVYTFFLFLLCVECQHELYHSRPKGKKRLTDFYVILSAGSFLGGVWVTWVAPLIFTSPSEYLFGLLLMSLGLGLKENARRREGLVPAGLVVLLIIASQFGSLLFADYKFVGIALFSAIYLFVSLRSADKLVAVPFVLGAVLSIAPYLNIRYPLRDVVLVKRNYYGIYYVSVTPDRSRLFIHGMTVHGIQQLDPGLENETTAYFHTQTPVGKFFTSADFHPERIGVVGLGVGTLAAYGREGQRFDFYELDPDVQKIADSQFTFLRNSKAKISYFYGDARINLAKSDVRYDVLVVDAFSGDSVPAHLLTTEAIEEYRTHLNNDGILLFHVSNRYFDLVPVLFSNAHSLKAYALVDSNPQSGMWTYASTWVAVTWDKEKKDSLASLLGWKEDGNGVNIKKIRPWTDGYSHLFTVFKRREYLGF